MLGRPCLTIRPSYVCFFQGGPALGRQTCQPEGQEIREANRPGVLGPPRPPIGVRGDAPVGARGGGSPRKLLGL